MVTNTKFEDFEIVGLNEKKKLILQSMIQFNLNLPQWLLFLEYTSTYQNKKREKKRIRNKR